MGDRAALEAIRTDEQKIRGILEGHGAVFVGRKTCCPFHKEKNPSAGIYRDPASGVWKFKCLSVNCGKQGDYFDVESFITGRAVEEIISEIGRTAMQRHENVPQTVEKAPYKSGMDIVRQWEKSPEFVKHWIYWKPDHKGALMVVGRFEKAGKKSYIQASPMGDGWAMKAPAINPIYNLDKLEGANNVVVCEGEKACDAVERLGLIATTSPAGSNSAGKADWRPLAGKNVTIWPDNDDAGRKYAADVEKILEALNPAAYVSMIDPNQYMIPEKGDAVDFEKQLKDGGASEVEIKLSMAQIISGARRKDGTEHYGNFVEDCVSGKFVTYEFPLPILTRLSRALQPESVTMLCGIGGASKSLFLIQCILFWMEKGIPCSCFMFEDSKRKHMGRAIAQVSGEPSAGDSEWIRLHEDRARKISASTAMMQRRLDKILFVESRKEKVPTFARAQEWIKSRAEMGDKIVILDPISSIPTKTANRAEEDLNFLMTVKDIALEYRIAVILATHPVKNSESAGGVGNMMGGAAYERFSHNIIAIEKIDPREPTRITTSTGEMNVNASRLIHIIKTRDGPGMHSVIANVFEPTSLRFVEQGIVSKVIKKKGPSR